MKLPELIRDIRVVDNEIQRALEKTKDSASELSRLFGDLASCPDGPGRDALVKASIRSMFDWLDKFGTLSDANNELHAILSGYTRELACEKAPAQSNQLELPFEQVKPDIGINTDFGGYEPDNGQGVAE